MRWTSSSPRTEFTVAASYQWRPNENFYGLGHRSSNADHTDFALRQSWVGAHLNSPPRYIRVGFEDKWISTRAATGRIP